jgi:hypothetical protein
MPSISIKQLNIANIGISFILASLAVYFQSESKLNNLSGLELLGGAMFIFSVVIALIKKNLIDNIAKTILLVTFVAALFVGFVPYISNVNDIFTLFTLANSIAAVWLILLFFTQYKSQ